MGFPELGHSSAPWAVLPQRARRSTKAFDLTPSIGDLATPLSLSIVKLPGGSLRRGAAESLPQVCADPTTTSESRFDRR